eukprot:Skav216269  [mRNA]  locus=scaffold1544:80403:84694:- [translate_table: standard]
MQRESRPKLPTFQRFQGDSRCHEQVPLAFNLPAFAETLLLLGTGHLHMQGSGAVVKCCAASAAKAHYLADATDKTLTGSTALTKMVGAARKVLRDTKEERLHHRNAVVTAVVDTEPLSRAVTPEPNVAAILSPSSKTSEEAGGEAGTAYASITIKSGR